jgi:hypothetical protein
MVTAAVYYVVCMPLYLLYSYMERRQYARHIRTYVQNLIQQRGDRMTTIEFSADNIIITDAEKNSITPRLDLEAIYETKTFFSFGLKNGKGLLIPKRVIPERDDLSAYLQDLAMKYGLAYEADVNWVWK